jgi:hypothetical protein
MGERAATGRQYRKRFGAPSTTALYIVQICTDARPAVKYQSDCSQSRVSHHPLGWTCVTESLSPSSATGGFAPVPTTAHQLVN